MRLFISYRRSDSQQLVDQLEEKLKGRLTGVEVFRDIGGIEAGENWKEVIDEKIETSDIVLVIIGSDWLTSEEKGKRRLNQPDDVVCHEIATALSRDVSLIPILVNGAYFPNAEDLPQKIQGLAWVNAHTINPRSFDADVNRLVKRLGMMLETTIQEQPSTLAREEASQLIQELQQLSKNDPNVEDFDSYWLWFMKAKETLRDLSTGTQVESQLKRLDLLLTDAKDSEPIERELTIMELSATLDEVLAYFSTAEEQRIDDRQTQEMPSGAVLLPGVDLNDFSSTGNWQCEISIGSENISIHFNMAKDGTISGSLINANGKNRLDGNYMLDIWTPPDKDRYVGSPPMRLIGVRLSGLMNRREPFDFEIPIEERIGKGYKGTDQQGHIFFIEKE